MTILEEFRGRYDAPPTDPAKKILFAVMGDLLSRKGFDGEWDGVDEEIQAEVLETNLDIIRKNLP